MIELISAILIAGATPVTNEADPDQVALRVTGLRRRAGQQSHDTVRVGGGGAAAGVGRTRRGMACV